MNRIYRELTKLMSETNCIVNCGNTSAEKDVSSSWSVIMKLMNRILRIYVMVVHRNAAHT